MARPTKSATIKRAKSGVGVTESPTNRTKFNRWFFGSDVSAPWCAIYVCWILIGAGFKTAKNASAHGLGEQLISGGWKRISAANIQSGDVVVFKISHIGLCKSRTKGGGFTVFEGNHSNRTAIVPRSASSFSYGVRPPYSPETVAANPVAPAQQQHTKYIVHGGLGNDPGRLTDYNGWEERHPTPAVKSFVFPAPELGQDYTECNGNVYTPIKWPGTNDKGLPNNGWYRKDYLQWAN